MQTILRKAGNPAASAVFFSAGSLYAVWCHQVVGLCFSLVQAPLYVGVPILAPSIPQKPDCALFAQALAKEYGPQGIHVGHVVIDGAIAGDKIFNHMPELAKKLGAEGMINIEGIVDGYVHLYNQSAQAWTFEIDLRTSIEKL